MRKAFLQGRHLPQPSAVACLVDAVFGVAGHVLDAAELRGVHAEEPASSAGVFVDAGRSVRSVAFTQGDPAQQEVFLEVRPLVGVGGPALTVGPQLAPPLDERLVGSNEVFGKHRGVSAGGIEIEVPEQGGGDVQWQPVVGGIGGEQATEVVGCEVHGLTGVGESDRLGRMDQNAAQIVPGQHLLADADTAGEQMRERITMDLLMLVVANGQRNRVIADLGAGNTASSTCTSSGVIGISRSQSFLLGTMCSSGTSVPVVGAV